MAMIPDDPLRLLLGLDQASPQFYEQLSNFIRGDEYLDNFPGLGGEGLEWLVEYLDGMKSSDHLSSPCLTLV